MRCCSPIRKPSSTLTLNLMKFSGAGHRGTAFEELDKVRLWSLVLNVKHVLTRYPGALAELGVYKGQSSAVLSYYAEKYARTLYLLDTFTGFATKQYEDGMGEGKAAAFKDTSLEEAQAVVGSYSGNQWLVRNVPGDRYSTNAG